MSDRTGSAQGTLVLALGNPLRGDDGIGPAVLDCLRAAALPPGVTLQDGGMPGLETVLLWEGYARVVIVDAAAMGEAPGAWRRFTPAEAALTVNDLHARVTVHYAGLAEALALGEALGKLPAEIVIYGVQPERIDWTPELSTPVRDAIPAICAAILDEVSSTP